MSKKVKITVTGINDTQSPDMPADTIKTSADGTYALMGDKHVISYEEVDEETGQALKTIVKFDENSAEVNRKGSIESKLVFIKGEKYETVYATPYGSFQMGTATHRFEKEENEKKINLHIDYDMEINNAFVSTNSIIIEIEFI